MWFLNNSISWSGEVSVRTPGKKLGFGPAFNTVTIRDDVPSSQVDLYRWNAILLQPTENPSTGTIEAR